MPNFRVGLNPLPWVLTPNGFTLSVPVLRAAFEQIGRTPFRGIHADPPDELDPGAYRELLAEYGLEPAPGYFAATLADEPDNGLGDLLERAKRHAWFQAALGNTEVFLADRAAAPRRAAPAVGTDFDPHRLQMVTDRVGAVAEAITAEGVRPALHPHIGTWIETETDLDAVLAGVPATILGFGPDTGHLQWAGMDPATVMTRYADRIAAIHLKDVHLDQVRQARQAQADYRQSTRGAFRVWTEPGRGDVDLDAALAALPNDYGGWIMVEVDVPDAGDNLESTQISARWVAEHLGADVFGGRR